MIFRTRWISTALLACGLALQPVRAVGQSASEAQGTSAPTAPQSASSSSSTSTGQPAAVEATPNAPANPAQPQDPQQHPVPTVTRSTGEEDRETEQMIQQELQTSGEPEAGPPRPGTNVALGHDEVLIRGDEQEKNQDIYKARGHVEIRFRTYILHADEATYDSTTGQVTAVGHVVFDGGPHDEHLVGTHATYDVSRDTGVFYDVVGSTGVKVKNQMMFLTSSTPFFFTGKVVDKLGPDRYRVNHGYVTSCQLPRPKWEFNSKTAIIEVGDEAKMHNATLRIHGIPLFYFPYMEHPVDNLGRKSGFLIPEIGQSNVRGFIFGDGFYWAINRNSDATIGASLYSSIGWAQYANYRVVGYKYRFHAQYFGVIDDKGPPVDGQNPGGHEFKADGFWDLPGGFRGVVSVDNLSSYLFRLRFALDYIEAILSEVRSSGSLVKNWNGYGLGFLVSRYQNYESLAPGDFIDIAHIPTFEFSSVERPFNRSRFVYAFDAAAEGVTRHEIGFETAPVVGRLDAKPYVSMPTFLHGWTFRPEASVRETYYTQRLEPNPAVIIGTAVDNPINRNVFAAAMEVRPPTLSKIFDRKLFGNVVKHTIEPYAIYRYQSGIDNFSQIIRFDQRDILADTNEVEYGVVNRLYAKKAKSSPNCYRHPKYALASGPPPQQNLLETKPDSKETTCDDQMGPARDVLTWEVANLYFFNPTFGGALVPGTRNVFDSTVDFTGIAFLTAPRRFSPITSRLRFWDNATDFEWALDYDPVLHQVNASTLFAGHRWANWYLSGGQTSMRLPAEVISSTQTLPAEKVNQYRIMLQYGGMGNKGFSGAINVGADAQLSYIQGSNVQVSYNWDCCGVAFLYNRWAPGAGLPAENAYRFSFSLSNVGTFGNIRRLQRLY
jgi:LPS-assembly protein